jgi:hypothetical protein
MVLDCQMCRKPLSKANRSRAHKTLCKDCYADVVKYKRYLKIVDKELKHKVFIKRMNGKFALNELDGRYVPKAYYNQKEVM